MNTEAAAYQSADVLDLAAATTYTAGQVIQIGDLAAMVQQALVSGQKGSALIAGLARVRAAAVVGNIGQNVWWDEDGTGVDGNTGCCTTNVTSGDFWIGTLAAALAATDGEAQVLLNQVNPAQPAWPTRSHKVDTTGTLTNDDGGLVLHIATVDQTITLPEIATVYIGMEVIIVNDCADAASLLTIVPNAADGFSGYGITHAVDKDLLNTKATSKRGDFIRLLAAGDTHWQVLERRGTWAREA